MVTYKFKKNGRVCYEFPWESRSLPQPWDNKYVRVLIPMTRMEQGCSKKKKVHIQIVARAHLDKVNEPKLVVQS